MEYIICLMTIYIVIMLSDIYDEIKELKKILKKNHNNGTIN